MLLVADVVLGALLGIAENRIGLVYLAEAAGVPRLRVVGMKALGQQPVHPVDHVGVGVWADLQQLVVIEIVDILHGRVR